MPKSKRDKKVSLTKTTKKGLVLKQKIVDEIRKAINKYQHVFLFTVHNMRNSKLKDLRDQWKDSRFFFGKNKVMALALGKSDTDEIEDQLSMISKRLSGQCGLLMTNKDVNEVLQWFSDYKEDEYARAGFKPKEAIILPVGPLSGFSHAMEPHLRKLGMPTSLERGVIHLIKEYEVCKKGVALTPEQANILKYLNRKLAKFRLVIKCNWSKGEGFIQSKNIEDDENEVNLLENQAMEEDET